ncbi:MAG: hypothetical protein ACTHKT_06150 [Solirubrobacterales bacterium]
MAQPGGPETGWSAMRPVLVAFLLVADAFAVAALAIARPKGWVGPFVGFGIVLVGLIWFFGWSIGHRHDDG